MSTGQKYSGKGDSTTQSTQTAQNEAKLAATTKKRSKSGITFDKEDNETVTIPMAFGGRMQDPVQINRLRQDIRAWFTAYIPVWESSFNPNDLEKSIEHFEVLDEFLSALVEEGITQMESKEGLRDDK
ncbi:hypothetical protein GO755_39870 [Spirosoma sp. HMF4905]|uniref:Uncharacterized protein n=1 Tax=Spirosoma arboris TaxID=2682092 RepID=A0A7K1SRN1_9BACT|nr:hypothetical protein [Spirosoma arboris]MVM36236.1 hypothetical protein [Spirosoma arboris]